MSSVPGRAEYLITWPSIVIDRGVTTLDSAGTGFAAESAAGLAGA